MKSSSGNSVVVWSPRRAWSWVVGLSVIAMAPVGAQDGPIGQLQTIDGRTLQGQLSMTPDGRCTLAEANGAVALDLAEIVNFAPAAAVAAVVAAPDRVWLRSGLELPAMQLIGKPGGHGGPAILSVQLPCGVLVDVPLGAIRALRHGGSERPEPRLFAADLREPPANEDLIYVQKDGQATRSPVTITGLQSDRIEFLLRGKEIDFPLVATTALVFGTNTGFAPNRQPKPRTTLLLTTGEQLEGRLLEVGKALRLRLDEGAVLDVPLAKLQRLSVASDRLVWLSDLQPKVEQTPAFDHVWPWGNDRSVAGPGFLIGGKSFARGIGMVPRTRLTYDLAGKFDVFEAMIGIDDRGGPAANAVLRVYVDGALKFESAAKTLGKPPEAVRVDLAKGRQLTIEADFGKNYDLGDFCAFADARVVQR